MKPEEPEDAEVIFADPRLRFADKSDMAGGEVAEAAAKRVQHLARRVGVKRVHGKVAPRGVLRRVVGEGDHRPAPIRRHIAPERGDLKRRAIGDQRDDAMVGAGRMGAEARRLRQAHRLRRRRDDGDVDVLRRAAHQRIAHAAADKERLGSRQRRHHPPGFGGVEPVRRDTGHARSVSAAIRSARLFSIPAVAPQIYRPSHGMA